MKKHILYGKSDGNKLVWEKPYDIKNLPGKLSKYGRYKCTFEKYVPGKSLKQLGYFYGGICPFLEKELEADTGLKRDDWKYILKEKFGIKEKDKSGLFTKVKSLADYLEPEMSLFITRCIEWIWDFFQMRVPIESKIEEYV